MDTAVPETPSQIAPPQIVLARERPFRLGAAEVRPGAREIVGPKGRETLEPRVMQVLVALARADGGILTRDDLIACCWDGRAVSEDAITRVISRLRRLSESRVGDGWSLETITKVGYRLLHEGQAAAHSPVPLAAAPTVTPEAIRPQRRALILGGAAAAVVAAGAGTAFMLTRSHDEASPLARQLYEKGRDAAAQGLPAESAQAIGFLKAAVADSPDYADGWGALALAYMGSLQFTVPERQRGVAEQSMAAANRALALKPNQTDATIAVALTTRVYQNWAAVERRVLHALNLQPREPRLEIVYNKLMLSVGRIKDSVRPAQIALAGDKFAPWYPYGLGTSLWAAGRTEEAEETVRKALALWPRHHALWFLLFNILAFTGRADEALAMAADPAARPSGIPPADVEVHLPAARALASGKAQDIETAAKLQLEVARRGVGYAENALMWLAAMGRVDDAFYVCRGMYFDEGFALGSQRFSDDQHRFMQPRTRNTHMLFMPPSASLRSDPRFGPLVKEIGLVAYWTQTGRGPDNKAWAWGQLA